jgi:hypothetical protein
VLLLFKGGVIERSRVVCGLIRCAPA